MKAGFLWVSAILIFGLGIFFTLYLSKESFDKSTLSLQEKCSSASRFFFEEREYSEKYLYDYESHYNKKLDKCFIFIKRGGFMEKEETFELVNTLEGRTLARYQEYNKEMYYCVIGVTECFSKQEFDSYVLPFMQD